MNFRTEVKILRVEPEGTMTLIEGGAPDGSMVMLLTRVVEPLRVGDSMTLTLTAEPAAATAGPSMWERMQARLKDLAPTSEATPRLSITLNNSNGSSAAPAGSVTAADNVNATGNPAAPVGASTPSAPSSASASGGAPQTPSAPGDASSMLLSSILGASPRGSVPTERNVVDEMDALFGARRKG